MRTRLPLAVVISLAVGLAGAGAVSADIGDNTPAGADVTVWQKYVANYRGQPDWSPQGDVVADSGFRAHPNGFSFFNTGRPDSTNNSMFGTAVKGPKNLDGAAMRSLMGKRVCVERQSTGTCTLTLAAKQWMLSTNEAMAGGHCFGFASTAAELFNTTLTPGQFQPGAGRTYDLRLRTPISRQIARNMASQYAMNVMDYRTSPRQAVELLKESLTEGSAPFTLFVLWAGGGHAVTPYAVYDKGNGKYDIGVYDNNYPDADRAVRINTKKNTYRYLVMTDPSGEPDIASEVIGLVPTQVIASKQSCPFCPGANETTVQLTPVKSQVPIKTRVTDLDGKKIPGVVVKKPTNPWRPGRNWEFPTYVIPKRQEFVVSIDARRSKRDVSTNVLAVTGQFTIGTQGAVIPAGGVGAVGLVPDKGLIVYGGEKNSDLGALTFVDTRPTLQVEVLATTGSDSSPFLLGQLNERTKRVRVFTPNGKAGEAETQASLSYANKRGLSIVIQAQASARLPRKGRLVIDYARWSPKKPQAIRAFVTARGVQTPVKVTVSKSPA